MAFELQEIWNGKNFELTEYEGLAKYLKENIKKYKQLVVTEDAITEAKKDRATLNNRRKMIDDLRKRVVKDATSLFEKQCKELVAIIDEGIINIDTQVKSYEEGFKLKKKEEIERLYASKDAVYFPLEKIWNPKWLNATYLMSNIEKEIDIAIDTYVLNMETLKSMCITSTEWKLGLDILSKTLDLNQALAEIKRIRTATKEEMESLDEPKHYIGFVCSLTANQAQKLGVFLRENHIEFKQLSEDELERIEGE